MDEARLLLGMASRNLRRHQRRSLISGSAVAFGLALLMVSAALGDGAHEQMIESGVRMMAGHVVVQARGWQRTREPALAVHDADAVVRIVEAALPGADVVPRVFFHGLLSSAAGSAGVGLTGVDAAREARVSETPARMVEGAWLDGSPDGILVGATLARTLKLKIGSKVVLMAQRRSEIESRLFRVRGIFRHGIEEIDAFSAQIPIVAAQNLLDLGGGVTQVAAHLRTEAGTADATRAVQDALAGTGLDVLGWRDALPDLHQWVVFDEAGMYAFMLVLFVIVMIGIANTVVMSVMERVREFGTMLALGLAPGRLRALVLLETALLGAGATVAGLAAGLLLCWPACTVGVDYAALAGGAAMEAAGVAMQTRVVGHVVVWKVGVFALATFAMTVASGVLPARRAARLRPVECLQHR